MQPNPPQLSDCAGVIRRQLPPALRHFAQTCSAPPTQYNTNLRYVTIFTTFLHITDECSFEGEPDGRQLTSSGFHRPGPAPPRNCYFFTSSYFSLDFKSQYEHLNSSGYEGKFNWHAILTCVLFDHFPLRSPLLSLDIAPKDCLQRNQS